MIKDFKFLIGIEIDVYALSIELLEFGCEDILFLGNLEYILDSGEMIVATDEEGEFNIKISFDVIKEEDDFTDTIIYIKDITEF
ncbi:MAG: hypothetical protein ACI3T9_00550 [Romboutsia timonensis]